MQNTSTTNTKFRMFRESKTIDAMIKIYCHDSHDSGEDLCNECKELLDYARTRLEKCPFQEDKPTCAKCPVHCYKPVMRERIRVVMRYAGPRMIFHHPLMAIQHLLDSRKQPIQAKKQTGNS